LKLEELIGKQRTRDARMDQLNGALTLVTGLRKSQQVSEDRPLGRARPAVLIIEENVTPFCLDRDS
jgi:hypothetical protein